MCGRGGDVRRIPWLRVQGGITFRIPAVVVGMVAAGNADMGDLFKREKDEWLRLRSAVSGPWPVGLSVAGCGDHIIRLNHLPLPSDPRREE